MKSGTALWLLSFRRRGCRLLFIRRSKERLPKRESTRIVGAVSIRSKSMISRAVQLRRGLVYIMKNKSNCLLILLIVFPYKAAAQIKSGTVAVIYFSDDKIVMAADSRATIDDGTVPDDTKCKVSKASNEVIFTMSGAAGYNSVLFDTVRGWDSLEEAKIAYRQESFVGGKSDIAHRTALRWGTNLAVHWNALYAVNPEKVY